MAPLAVWDELETIVAPLEPLLVPRGLYLDVVVAPDVPATLACDGKAFRAILTNLFSNAVKFTERGGLVVTLEVVAPTGGVPVTPWALRVGVTDTGCGIPADRWEAIFAPFEQVDEALNRRHAGTGLGLSIVKGYTDLLGGRITVASTLDRGSTFTVELPLHPVDEPSSVRPPTADALPAGLRALVVDERASFRAAVAARLTRLGIAVEAHAIPWTALVAAPLPENPHDLLIVQNLATPSADPGSIAGLRGRAKVLVALETRYDAAMAQRAQDAGSILALWSGATCARWRAALARVFRDTDASAAAPARSAAAPPLAGQTVLVVEDYAINRTIMAHQLRGNGARVLEAGDGDAAVALAAEPGLDLILMDIQMPGKDGIAAIQEIRRWPAGARLPILGFTASADKPTHQRILQAGADGVLTKPLGEADLVRAVRRALRRNRPAFPIPGEG